MDDIKSLAKLLDDRFKGPFGFRFGLDGIIGLIPGVGDVITNIIAFYIILRAAVAGYPVSLLLRMVLNLIIENLVDWIPFFGNIFDFFWRANRKNIELIEAYEEEPQPTTVKSIVIVSSLLAFAVMFCLFMVVGSIALLIKLSSYIVGHIPI